MAPCASSTGSFKALRLVPVDLDVPCRTAGRRDVGQLVAVEVADDEILRVHSAIVDQHLRLERAVGADQVDGEPGLAAAPADRELLAAVAVEIGPSERVSFGER